jgi:aminoglycoside N3'-acetyltransferase
VQLLSFLIQVGCKLGVFNVFRWKTAKTGTKKGKWVVLLCELWQLSKVLGGIINQKVTKMREKQLKIGVFKSGNIRAPPFFDRKTHSCRLRT